MDLTSQHTDLQLSAFLIKHHTRKVNGGEEVQIYIFLTSPEMEAKGKLHTLAASSLEEEPISSCPVNTRLEVHQNFFCGAAAQRGPGPPHS